MQSQKIAAVALLIAITATASAPSIESVVDTPTETATDVPRHRFVQAELPVVFKRVQHAPVLDVPAVRKSIRVIVTNPGPQVHPTVHTVRSGDTISVIANAWKMPIHLVATRNCLTDPDRIYPGMKILRAGKPCPRPVVRPQKTVAVRTVAATSAPAPRNGSAAEHAIAFALAQVGDPYLWGGDGPNAWDCSGLVHAAYRAAGISITRGTKTLINDGYAVSRAALQRGDLVFPHSGHVGIYVGNGQMVHAPEPGDVVKVAPVYAFWAARRVA